MRDRRQIGGRYLARVRGAFRGGRARSLPSVEQPANPEAKGATRAPGPPRVAKTAAPAEILGPPWLLSSVGGMAAQSL